MKKVFWSYKNYVCPNCFHKLHECTCDYFPPYGLIFIDENIQDHVRLLNEKGYITNGCCEGHYESYSESPYVNFVNDYNFTNIIPDGFMYSKKKRRLLANINEANEKDFECKKKELLAVLLSWIENLPQIKRG